VGAGGGACGSSRRPHRSRRARAVRGLPQHPRRMRRSRDAAHSPPQRAGGRPHTFAPSAMLMSVAFVLRAHEQSEARFCTPAAVFLPPTTAPFFGDPLVGVEARRAGARRSNT